MSTSQNMSSVDPEELKMFKDYAPDWWDEMGPVKALHTMNQVRISFVLDGLVDAGIISREIADSPTPFKDLRILEAGCGGGIFSEALAKLGGTVTGIDPSPELIQQAKQHAVLNPSLTNLTYLLETVEEHAINNYEKYDIVISAEVLEHVLDHKKYLEVCVKCLMPGGSIFITTENKNFISWLGAIVFAEYVFNCIPRGAFKYNKFISPSDVKRILEGYKCSTKAVRGMSYNLLRNTWSFTWHSLIFYGLYAVKK